MDNSRQGRSEESLPFVTAAEVLAFGYPRAVASIEAALQDGLDPSSDPARTTTPVGEEDSLLYMPSLDPGHAGVKLVSHKPSNSATGHPLVHGVYVLFDRATLAPIALLDGAALTILRTPAVSVAAVRPFLRRFARPINVVAFGLGPQGVGHLDALCEVAAADIGFPAVRRATYVVRGDVNDPRLPRREDVEVTAIPVGSRDMISALKAADVIVCATSSRTPLFDSSLLSEESVTIAVGSHSPDAAEVDTKLCARALIIVEDVAAALRECGEIVAATREGAVSPEDLIGIPDAVTGNAADSFDGAPVLFKGAGMAWEDLVVAKAIVTDATTRVRS